MILLEKILQLIVQYIIYQALLGTVPLYIKDNYFNKPSDHLLKLCNTDVNSITLDDHNSKCSHNVICFKIDNKYYLYFPSIHHFYNKHKDTTIDTTSTDRMQYTLKMVLLQEV